jgi:hypothetical protein
MHHPYPYHSRTVPQQHAVHPQPRRASIWQRNYYEHVIRNEESLNRIREYIMNNPLQWEFDRENPSAIIIDRPVPQTKSGKPAPKDEPWRV